MTIAAVALALAPAAAASAPALVVFHAAPGPDTAPAREAVARAAAASGAAFVDLSPAPAPEPAAAALLARGIEELSALRLDEAQTALDAALAEARSTGAAGLSATQLSDLFLHRSLLATQRGNADRAWEELVRAATVDPARILDAARFPPRVLQAFERAAAAVRAARQGHLAVDASPACAVSLDARRAEGPRELPYGEHFVRLDCPGERPAGGVFVLGQPAQTVTPPRAPVAPPDDAALLALGRERRLDRVLVVEVTGSAAAPPTARLRLLDSKRGTPLAETAAAARDPEGVRSATERLLTGPGGAPLVAAPTRWYQKPWVWGLAGVAITAAILIPFVVDSSAGGFSVAPDGIPR